MSYNIYSAGETKEPIRNYTFFYFKNCSHVLTLPNLYFDLEQTLLNNGKKVDCCEYREDIYLQQLKIAPKEIKLHNIDAKHLNYVNYDGVFVDIAVREIGRAHV